MSRSVSLKLKSFPVVAIAIGALCAFGAVLIFKYQLLSLAPFPSDAASRMRQILVASKEDPGLVSGMYAKNGGLYVWSDQVIVQIDEYTGQFVLLDRSIEFYKMHPYRPGDTPAIRSESEARNVMVAFLRDAGVDMESFELEKFAAYDGPKAAQFAHGHERPVFSAHFAERKSDIRLAGAGSRRGTIVLDGTSGRLISFAASVIPPAAPWEVNLTEARAKELATESWREWGASFDSKQMRVKTQYVRSGSSYKVLPEDRLIPAFLLGASTDADSWQCFATIDARDGKVMDSTCQIPSRMRGE